MSEINLVAVGVVLSLIGLVAGLIIWRNFRGRGADNDYPGPDGNKTHQKPVDRPDVRS